MEDKIVVWQRVLCRYLNLRTVRREPTSRLSSVSLPITRTEMPDSWPPLFLHAIYLSPAIAYSIAREPLARVIAVFANLCSHPRFVRILVRVSRSCPDKPYFGLPRTLMSWSLSGHWVVHMSHFCGTAYGASRYVARVFHKMSRRSTWSASESAALSRILPFTMAERQLQSKMHYLEILSSCALEPTWYARFLGSRQNRKENQSGLHD